MSKGKESAQAGSYLGFSEGKVVIQVHSRLSSIKKLCWVTLFFGYRNKKNE
jgi:hypothetical protein